MGREKKKGFQREERFSKVLGNKFWELCGNYTEGRKHRRAFISNDNYDNSKCHILKDNYGSYEVFVLYGQL